MLGNWSRQNRKRSTKILILAIVFIAAGAVSISTIWGASPKSAALSSGTQSDSNSTLLTFLGVVTMLTVAVPSKFLERQHGEEREWLQQSSDPRTVLESRRELLDSLDMEIKRARRSQGTVAFLRIQIDGENKISGESGHDAAEIPLRRLAQVLQASCRELDIVLRYDEDEFAVVFPDAGPETICHVTRRIRQRSAGDRKLPPISLSFGAAMYPKEGESLNTLLLAADRNLCGLKLAPVAETRPPVVRIASSENLHCRERELSC